MACADEHPPKERHAGTHTLLPGLPRLLFSNHPPALSTLQEPPPCLLSCLIHMFSLPLSPPLSELYCLYCIVFCTVFCLPRAS